MREPGQFCIRKSRQTAEVAQGKTKKTKQKKPGRTLVRGTAEPSKGGF